jgi:phospholipase C
MAALNQIEHVIVLMLENRSFDNMLGLLYPKSPGFDGLAGIECNLNMNGKAVPVWNSPGSDGKHSLFRIPIRESYLRILTRNY